MTSQEKELKNIALPIVQDLGYVLYDVEYVKEGKEWFVRIYIDNENGIDLDDCEKVSEALSDELDKVDPIPTAYSLEVSSCGLERKLKEKWHFEDAVSKNIEVKLFKSLNGEKMFSGILQKVEESFIVIANDENKEIQINFDDISNAKILFNWEE